MGTSTPGKKHNVQVSVTTTAEPEDVFRLLADGSTWPSWSPVGSFQLISEATGGGEGVGAVRLFRNGPFVQQEEIVRVDAPRVFGYRLVESKTLHVSDYEAEVSLQRSGSGTSITWAGSFNPSFPGTGWLWERILRHFYKQFASGLAQYADEL